jgi:hypothetical protein
MRAHPGLGIALLLALLTVGCVNDSRPDAAACAADSIEIDVTLTSDALTPENLAVCRDQDVTLRIASEVDGLIHIHGYDEIVPATEVTNGNTLELSFVAERDGQYPIELHPAGSPEGVSVGIFTVHER